MGQDAKRNGNRWVREWDNPTGSGRVPNSSVLTNPQTPSPASDSKVLSSSAYGNPEKVAVESQLHLLRAVAEVSQALLAADNLQEGLLAAVRLLGNATGVDRVHVLRFEKSISAVVLNAEWARAGISPLSLIDAGPFSLTDYAEVFAVLLSGSVYHSPLREKSGANRDLNERTATFTDLHVPIFVRGDFWGILNLDDCTTERTWTTGEVELLQAAAAAVASSVVRETAEREKIEAVTREREIAATQLVAELTRANDALQAVTDSISKSSDLHEIIPLVLRQVARTFSVQAVAFYELEQEVIQLRYWCRDGAVLNHSRLLTLDPDGPHAMLRKLAEGFSVPRQYLGDFEQRARRGATFINHLQGTGHPTVDGWALANGWEFELNAPCFSGNKVQGALCIYRSSDRPYSALDVSLAESLARQLALAIQVDRLGAEVREVLLTREREHALAMRSADLKQINDALSSSVAGMAAAATITGIEEVALRETMRVTGADAGAVYRRLPGTTQFKVALVHTEQRLAQGDEASNFPPAREICEVSGTDRQGYFAALCRGVWQKQTMASPLAVDLPLIFEYCRDAGLNSIWDVPLGIEGEICGYVSLWYRGEISSGESTNAAVRALATQAGLALELARMAEQSQEIAKAHEVLRRSRERLSGLADIDDFLLQVVISAAEVAGAVGGGIGLLSPNRDALDVIVAVDNSGPEEALISRPELHSSLPLEGAVKQAWERIVQAPGYWSAGPDHPSMVSHYRAYHESRAHQQTVHLVISIQGVAVGFLALSFLSTDPLLPHRLEMLKALADHAALALEVSQMAAMARERAVATEREQFAERRAAELTEINRALQVRDTLLSAAAEASRLLLESADIGTVLPQVLELMGRTALWSRAKIIVEELAENGEVVHRVAAEWVAEGITSHLAHPLYGRVPNSIAQQIVALLHSGQPYWFPSDNLPTPLQEIFRALEIRTTAVVPIFIDAVYFGVIVFDDCVTERSPSSHELDTLRTVSRIIAAAIQRGQLVDAVARERERAAEERAETLRRQNTLLVVANEASRMLLIGPDDLGGYQEMLAQLGHHFDLDRVAVARLQLDKNDTVPWCEIEHEWTAPGVRRQMDDLNLRRNRFAMDQGDLERFLGGEILQGHLAQIPEFALEDQLACGFKSGLAIPLFIGGQVWGVLGGDNCRYPRRWDTNELSILRLVGDALSANEQRSQSEAMHRDFVALERQQAAEERATQLANANQALQRTLAQLAAQPDPQDFLGVVLVEACRKVNADGGQLALVEEDNQSVVTFAHYSNERLQPLAHYPARIQARELGALSVLERCGGPRFFDLDTEAHLFWPGTVEWHRSFGTEDVLVVPMMSGPRLVGYMGFAFRQSVTLLPEVAELLTAFAHQAALASELIRLGRTKHETALAQERERAAEQRVAELARTNRTLQRSVDALAMEPNLEQALGHVLAAMSEHLGSRSAALWMFDEVQELFVISLVFLDGKILAASDAEGYLPPGDWKELRTISFNRHTRERRPVIYQVGDDSSFPEKYRAYLHQHLVRSVLGVPLLIGDEIVGHLTMRFEKRESFSQEEMELAQAIAHQAGLALRLVRLGELGRRAAVMEERTRLARDIHDTLAQGFTAINAHLQAVGDQMTPADRHHLEIARELALQNLTTARHSVRSLRPHEMTERSLKDALGGLVEQFRKQVQEELVFNVSPDHMPALEETVEAELFRIAQEALNNCVRHARAQLVEVTLRVTPSGAVMLTVRDNGCGFDLSLWQQSRGKDVLKGGFGMTSMSERARRIDASLTIISEPGFGTEVTVAWPSRIESLDGGGDHEQR
ncbi:GAF domain-containing protein [Nostoc sp. NIES-2111]